MDRQLQLFARLQAEAPAPRARQDHPGVVSYYDLPYAVVPGFRPLALDLHLPDDGGPSPVLLWVHGGGWAGGSRAMGHAIALVRHGYAVAAAQYRLSGEARYPAQLHDLKGSSAGCAPMRRRIAWMRGTSPAGARPPAATWSACWR
jgi:acetyl esterase/lipase